MRTCIRAVAGFILAITLVLTSTGMASASSPSYPAAATVSQTAPAHSTQAKPLITERWWGWEVRLTREQTDYAARSGAALTALFAAGPIAGAIASVASDGMATIAKSQNKCLGYNVYKYVRVPFQAAGIMVPLALPVIYGC